MRKIFTIIILASLCISVTKAQELKFKDVYQLIKTAPDYEVYQQFCQLQKQDPYSPVIYYQLGLISQKWMRQFDPFLESQSVREFTYNANLYFNLCLKYFNEKEASRNGEYYQAVTIRKGEDEPIYEDIYMDIKERLTDVKTFKENFEHIDSSLVNCVNNYNECIQIFKRINEENSRMKELLFVDDLAFNQDIKSLKIRFDSTLYYSKALRESLKRYPLRNYCPEFFLKPIDVYRLHGLTSANFINDRVYLWDFASWYDYYTTTKELEISDLFRNATITDQNHRKYFEDLKQKNNDNIPQNYAINPLIINKMRKYDTKSSMADLFVYQESKIVFWRQYNTLSQLNSKLRNDYQMNHVDYFMNLFQHKYKTDSLLNDFKTDATSSSIDKYALFFSKSYKDYADITAYINKQNVENDSLWNDAINDYASRIIKSYMPDSTMRSYLYKGTAVRSSISAPKEISGTGYFTHSKSTTNKGLTYLTGSYIVKEGGISVAFVAVTDSGQNLKWLKILKTPKTGHQYGCLVQGFGDGCVVIVTNKANGKLVNYAIVTDNEGSIKAQQELTGTAIPRSILYDDINQTYLIASKGIDYNAFTPNGDSLYISLHDAQLKTKWRKSFGVDGILSSVIKVNDLFYVYGAYNKLAAKDKNYSLADGLYNCFVNVLDQEGNWLNTNIFANENSIIPLKVNKINSGNIDIIAVKDEKPDELFNLNKRHKAYYFITSPEGIIYKRK
jgi:hypothetical protein